MEKSYVRQFTGFGNSFFGTSTKNGFIRTFHDENDLGKQDIFQKTRSRIQNLPSYRKDDLSKRFDMVVVFQSIQIERLSLQIQSLRVQLKDSQRQLKNYLSYQVQIKQLTQHCLHLEEQNMQYKEQIEKMNMICQKMYSQLQQLHQKYDGIDLQIEKKYEVKVQQNKNLQKQIQNIRNSFNKKSQGLTNEKIVLCNKVKIQQNQIKNLQQQIKKGKYKQELKKQVLEQLFRLKNTQIELVNLNNRILKQVEQKINLLQNMKAIVKNKLTQSQKEKEKLEQMYGGVNTQLSNLQQSIKSQNEKVQKQIFSLSLQNEKLKKLINDQQEVIQQISGQFDSNLRGFQQQLHNLSLKIQEKNRQIIQLKKQKGSLQKRVLENQTTKKMREQEYTLLKNEFINLKELQSKQITNLNRENNLLQNKISSIFKQIQEKSLIVKQLKNVVLTFKKQNQNNYKEKEVFLQKFNSFIHQIENISQQFNKQRIFSQELQQKIQMLQISNRNSQKDKNDLQYELKDIEDKLNKQRSQKCALESEKISLSKKLKEEAQKLIQKEKQQLKLQEKIENEFKNQRLKLQSSVEKISSQLRTLQESYKKTLSQKNLSNEEFNTLKSFSQKQAQSINQLLQRIQSTQSFLKQAKCKTSSNINQNQYKINGILSKFNQIWKVSQGYAAKIIQLQNMVALLQNDNCRLEGEKKILNFQMVQIHKINSMQKRRDSRTSTQSTSLKSFVNSNSMIKNKQKFNSFIRSSEKQSIGSQISQSNTSERKIFGSICQNRPK